LDGFRKHFSFIGYVYEGSEKKYELEIKFNDDLPLTPPHFLYHKNNCELLSEIIFLMISLVSGLPLAIVFMKRIKFFF